MNPVAITAKKAGLGPMCFLLGFVGSANIRPPCVVPVAPAVPAVVLPAGPSAPAEKVVTDNG